jgi:phosphohistidine phosphatase
MLIVLARHAEAASAPPGHSDAERPLTARGREQAAEMGRGLADLIARDVLPAPPLGLFHSNFRRARETAEGWAAAMEVPTETVTLLHPGSGISDVDVIADLYGRPPALWMVAHQPAVGEIVRQLTKAVVAVPPGTVALMEASRIAPGQGRLIGFFPPGTIGGQD